MSNGKKNGLGEQGPEEQNLFLVARGAPHQSPSGTVRGMTPPAPFAGEGEQVAFLAVITADTGEPAFQIAAVHELVHHLLAYHGKWYVFAWNRAKERVAIY